MSYNNLIVSFKNAQRIAHEAYSAVVSAERALRPGLESYQYAGKLRPEYSTETMLAHECPKTLEQGRYALIRVVANAAHPASAVTGLTANAGIATVRVGDNEVSVKREGSSETSVARILGRIERDGVLVIALDRLVHKPFEAKVGEWNVSGAITTLLSSSLTKP